MLTGLVLLFALLAVGFGFVVFGKARIERGIIWDFAFVGSSIAFLVAFIAVICRFAASEVIDDSRRVPARGE